MSTTRRIIATVLSIAILSGYAAAQSPAAKQPALEQQQQSPAQSQSPAVTAAATGEGVRFTAPGEVFQTRVEVYSASGELVFDTGARAGGVVDFKAADAHQGLADGSYLFVVTVKDLRGRASQRVAVASVQSGQLSLLHANESELTDAQARALDASRRAQKIEATEPSERVAIMRDGRERAVTVATHDGAAGSVTSTSGALTFRTGDLFAGREQERVRITPDGRVGIGTSDPQATLDVAGAIRARGGIQFDDGTVLKSAQGAARGAAFVTSPGTAAPLGATATTTANQLVKWADANGTAADSAVTEVNGNVGVGIATPNPNGVLHVNKTQNTGTSMFVTNDSTGTGALSSMRAGLNPSNYAADYATMTILGTNWPAGAGGPFLKSKTTLIEGNGSNMAVGNYSDTEPLLFYTTSQRAERMRINANGNVGIGTATPAQKLDVAGSIRMSAPGSALYFSDGTSMTTAATGGGGSMTGAQIVNALNSDANAGFIGDARLSPNVARLAGQNAWTGQNTFVNGLSANGVAITNVGNPVSATDATNKAYVAATTVQFVPGAEQLSVGDANGTAAMINLRGGSTCCSGPGGHTPAWFKVFQNGSFVATGNLGIGVSPMQGKGYRTSWDSYKGAFRSGYADAEWDDANVGFFSWAGGSNSTAVGLYALAFGDTNQAESTSSIVFGSGNQVKGAAGFSAGAGNRVCDTYGVALGNNAKSGGPFINGRCDTDSFNIHGLAAVAIGYNVTADQDHTMAFGKFASNNGFTGTFVWSDGSATASADTFKNTANNEFAARATGGFRFRTNLAGTTGCNLPAGSGVFNCTSSRTTKENFLNVSGEDVLARVRKLSVSTWNYIAEGHQTRHMGPMAEDFYAAFGLGTNNISIGVQDLAGVSLAAVKALEARTTRLQETNDKLGATLKARDAEVSQLRSELNSLRATTDALAARLDALEQRDSSRNAHARRTTARRHN